MTEGQKTIPFATELETGKWMYDSDKWVLLVWHPNHAGV